MGVHRQLYWGLVRDLFIAQMGAYLEIGRCWTSDELARNLNLYRPPLVRKMKSLEDRGYLTRAGHHHWDRGYPTAQGWREWFRLCAEPALLHTPPKKHKNGMHRNANHKRWDGNTLRTVYPGRVVPPTSRVLMPGSNNQKLGGEVTKGRLRGYRIYSLTLEERHTCSPDCEMLRPCYGNSMPYANRFEEGELLERQLQRNVGHGIERKSLIRLHTLGDFYSPGYVLLWRKLMHQFPDLHVFGFSRWWPGSSIVGDQLLQLREALWPRFALRFSFLPGPRNAVVVKDGEDKPEGSFWCPQQTGQAKDCGACGACWSTDKTVAFKGH